MVPGWDDEEDRLPLVWNFAAIGRGMLDGVSAPACHGCAPVTTFWRLDMTFWRLAMTYAPPRYNISAARYNISAAP